MRNSFVTWEKYFSWQEDVESEGPIKVDPRRWHDSLIKIKMDLANGKKTTEGVF